MLEQWRVLWLSVFLTKGYIIGYVEAKIHCQTAGTIGHHGMSGKSSGHHSAPGPLSLAFQ